VAERLPAWYAAETTSSILILRGRRPPVTRDRRIPVIEPINAAQGGYQAGPAAGQGGFQAGDNTIQSRLGTGTYGFSGIWNLGPTGPLGPGGQLGQPGG
jgi:hypothetical protein